MWNYVFMYVYATGEVIDTETSISNEHNDYRNDLDECKKLVNSMGGTIQVNKKLYDGLQVEVKLV